MSDEQNCPTPPFSCPTGQWQCPNDQLCIDQDKVCDGQKNCPNGADESPLCSEYLLFWLHDVQYVLYLLRLPNFTQTKMTAHRTMEAAVTTASKDLLELSVAVHQDLNFSMTLKPVRISTSA